MKNTIKFNACSCKRGSDEPVVMNDLAVTPAQMMKLTEQGYSITAQNLRMLDAVDPADKDFYIPLQYRKGCLMSDLYEASQDVRSKFKKAVQDYDDGKIKDVRPAKTE